VSPPCFAIFRGVTSGRVCPKTKSPMTNRSRSLAAALAASHVLSRIAAARSSRAGYEGTLSCDPTLCRTPMMPSSQERIRSDAAMGEAFGLAAYSRFFNPFAICPRVISKDGTGCRLTKSVTLHRRARDRRREDVRHRATATLSPGAFFRQAAARSVLGERKNRDFLQSPESRSISPQRSISVPERL
jgi:hypothetical protein